MNSSYNIVMFAYNEERNIEASIKSVKANIDEDLNKFFLIANGCSDKTVHNAKKVKKNLRFNNLQIIEIAEGDKCNAWNTYVHTLADSSEVHFFVDADVCFTANSFPLMFQKLKNTNEQTIVIAGMPQTGRNIDAYRKMVTDKSCFFGNLYGLKHSFILRVQEDNFFLPKGLNWIDSFLTKAVNTDLQFFNYNLPNRTTYIEEVGYSFKSLSPFKGSDIKLYFNRIARYELGKIQEVFLDSLPVKKWPKDMKKINLEIKNNFTSLTANLTWFKKALVKKRLTKLLKQGTPQGE